MKKAKLTLGIVSALVATGALAACNEVTYNEGVVLSYTDAAGKVTNYTAEELFGSYMNSSSAASTAFNKVQEVLIRKFYEEPSQAAALAELKTKAQKKVSGLKDQAETNAKNNGTKYQEEFEKLLDSAGVDNVDQLLDQKLYEEEKDKYTTDYYTQQNLDAIRDGKKWEGLEGSEDTYGPVTKGYLKDKMPYHVSHILVKLASASSNEHAQATISSSESKKLSDVVKELAGADSTDETGKTTSKDRLTFGNIAYNLSEDDGSAKEYGDLKIMDKDTEFVQEFKLGLYAVDAIYNKQANTYGDTVKNNLLPSADAKVGSETVTSLFEARGIGTIPYGAFVALGDDDVSWASHSNGEPDLGYEVNSNSSTFYPRNVLFNKYMNNHQIAVITPNSIDYNDFLEGTGSVATNWASYKTSEVGTDNLPVTAGKASTAYANLPGFQNDTKGIIDSGENVLTNEKGQIVFAVRAGTSSYQGIHFITVDRSALAEYATPTGALATKADYGDGKSSNVTSLSEYWTMLSPSKVATSDDKLGDSNYYPSYKNGDKIAAKTTFVNKFQSSADSNYTERTSKISSAVKDYDKNMDTYMIQELLEAKNTDGTKKINFKNEKIGDLVKSYIKSRRVKAVEDKQDSFDEAWITYAEYLQQQDAARKMKDDGSQRLISEVCAIGYGSNDAKAKTGDWAKGGACYDGK